MQNNKLNVNNKKIYIEFLRIMAAFLVIVNHTNSRIFLNTQPSALWVGSISYFFISKIAVPVFLMIMGAVLLDKQDGFKKYIGRVLRIIVVTAFFAVLAYLTGGGGFSARTVVREIINSSTEPYWYLYLYIGLLIILPVMQKMAKSLDKKDIQLLLFAALAVGGIVPMLEFIGFGVHKAFLYGAISPYIGMVFAGYYIEKYMDITAKKAGTAALMLVLLTLAQVLVSYKAYRTYSGVDYLWLDNAGFIPITASAICAYIIVKYIFEKIEIGSKASDFICFAGGLTFGIYLMGDFFKSAVEPVYNSLAGLMPDMLAMVIYEIAIFVLTAAAVAVIKLIPIVKKFI